MKEILCVHAPRYYTGSDIKIDSDGTMVTHEVRMAKCVRCSESWKDGDPEPDVVIGKIR